MQGEKKDMAKETGGESVASLPVFSCREWKYADKSERAERTLKSFSALCYAWSCRFNTETSFQAIC